uniref:Upstream transcription factor 2, c-fos interacting n=1 Tax=Tetraodon nigroviridis TaxID=99883 RepID=H3CAB5_TETNG
MDMLEQSLDSSARCASIFSHDKQETDEVVQLQEGGEAVVAEEQTAVIAGVPQAAFADNVQYQFRTENNGGQVTYRVVQVTDEQLEATADGGGAVSVVSTAAFAGAPQAVAQVSRPSARRPRPLAPPTPPGPAAGRLAAVIQNPFSNGSSPAAETVGAETFAYFPAAAVSEGTAVSVQAAADPTITQAGGQFYVMMNPEVLQTASPRTIAPRTHTYTAKVEGSRAPRDERRRAQHNEVERRRRDKINNWIVTLSKIIPDCSLDSRTGASKGGILSKACDYIRELRQNNQQLQESYKEVERVEMDNELLRQQIEELKNDNALLRAQLQQHGIELNGEATPQ